MHVVYGLVGLKTHAKILLVVRQEADGIRRYCHVGTGNYNPETATLYEDLGLLTADPELGADLTELFNHLTGYSRQGEYRKLLVAPDHLRDRTARADPRAGARGRRGIVLKMNALVDPEIIDELYDGVRGGRRDRPDRARHLLPAPGGPGPLRATSACARSSAGTSSTRGSTASAERDSRRVLHRLGRPDAAQPRPPRRGARRRSRIPRCAERLDEILSVLLADDTLAWTLAADGTWDKVPTERGANTHLRLQELAVERAGSEDA